MILDGGSVFANPAGRPSAIAAFSASFPGGEAMEGRAVPALCVGILCAASASWGGDDNGAGGAVSSPAVAAVAVAGAVPFESRPIEPWIHNSMSAGVRKKLETGFQLAIERVREVASCRDLFARLGRDGIETLKTGLYLPVDSYRREVEVCGRSPSTTSRIAANLSYTKVGAAATWVCRHFSEVSDETAAVTVIHEALHHAGLTERPVDRMAMSSVEITEMVRNACRF